MTIEVKGGPELRRAFRDVAGKDGAKRLKEAYVDVSQMATSDAKTAAGSGTDLQQKMATALRPVRSVKNAGVAINRTGANAAAGVAFYGSKSRIGWFAAPKFAAYTAQDQELPPWIGNTWTSATRGEGPHRINDALARNVDRYTDRLGKGIYQAADDVGLT